VKPSKPSYTGQRIQPATDRKFHPTDEHLIEQNKEELDRSEFGDRTEAAQSHDRDKFAEMDKKPKKAK
jgi:hypothetical protein